MKREPTLRELTEQDDTYCASNGPTFKVATGLEPAEGATHLLIWHTPQGTTLVYGEGEIQNGDGWKYSKHRSPPDVLTWYHAAMEEDQDDE